MERLSVTQFASAAGVKRHTILHAIAIGRLQAEREGNHFVLSASELDSPLWLSRKPGKPGQFKHDPNAIGQAEDAVAGG